MTELPITIKRVKTSRRLKLRIMPNGDITVTAHPFVADRIIDDFVTEHLEWIMEKRQAILTKRSSLTENKSSVFFRGKELKFRLQINPNFTSGVETDGEYLTVTAPAEDHTVVRGILEDWYRAEAKKYFEQRVPLLADLMGYDVMRVTVRDQRSRWGSCSSKQNISLNWRLIQAPDWVSDYVVYHELSHLQHMDHSARFWKLVESYIPKYKEAEGWLKEHHQLLHF
jgi:predicted metal-dependent hydrolase